MLHKMMQEGFVLFAILMCFIALILFSFMAMHAAFYVVLFFHYVGIFIFCSSLE